MSNLHEGQIVEVKKNGVLNHPGILVWDVCGWAVVHNTPNGGGVIKQTLEEFTNGEALGFPTRYKKYLPDHMIAQRARSMVGQKWGLLGYNCQHFVTQMCGGKAKSHDLEMALLLVIIGLFGVALTRRA